MQSKKAAKFFDKTCPLERSPEFAIGSIKRRRLSDFQFRFSGDCITDSLLIRLVLTFDPYRVNYPVFGENLSRTSSRSSTVSQASRTTYSGVSEEILERVSQAKTARLAARARYEAALANPDLPNSVITKLEDDLSKCEDELKFARIERTRAKFSGQHFTSSRPLLPAPLPVPAPPQYSSKSLLQPVTEDLDLFLERGEELEKLGHKVNVEGGCKNRRASTTTNQIDLARTDCDSAQLLDQRAATLPGQSLHPSIPVSPLLQIATRFSSQLRNMLFLEQREDPSDRHQRADAKTGLQEDQRSQVADEPNTARTECDLTRFSGQHADTPPGLSECRDHAKILDRHVAPRSSIPPPLLSSFLQRHGVEYLAPSLEQGGESRKPLMDFDRGVSFKAGEEVEVMGGREERTQSVHDVRAQLHGHYEHEGRSRTIVPLDREQYTYVLNTPRTMTRPVPYHTTCSIPAMQQPDEPKPDEQHKVYRCTFTNQESVTSKGSLDEEGVPYLVPPNFLDYLSLI
ncbi:hypothetical protein K435DRAFT_966250 [Dendrothele bispora CBS 962.96]|uniref:Uncharacterized protein n=1 Tax=Dendrothele bispora (strain CBS 962.96) TaxID=1314807 RepID=A0A4S8M1P6_DENBC|nr:hypothetical protein K435DRAFT_966250 [Dendrothele bispora CBS 962.96]